jgi:hypothetical protein
MRPRNVSIKCLAIAALAFPAALSAAEETPSEFKSYTLPPQMEARSAAKLLRELDTLAEEQKGRIFVMHSGALVVEGPPAFFGALDEKITAAVKVSGIPLSELKRSGNPVLSIEQFASKLEEGANAAATEAGDKATTTTMAWALSSPRAPITASRAERLREHEARIRELIEERKRSKQAEADGKPVPQATQAAPAVGTPVYTGPKSGKRVTVAMKEVRIEQAAMLIGTQIGTSVDVYGNAMGTRVTIVGKDKPLEDTLDSLVAGSGLVWWKREDGRYGISDKAYYESSVLPATTRLEVYTAKGTKAQDLQRMLTELRLLSPNGRASLDADNNRVAVTDTPAAHKAIREAIAKLEGGAAGKPD